MTGATHPSIAATAMRGWQDAFAALSRMPILFGIAIAALCVLNMLALAIFAEAMQADTVGAQVLNFLFGVVQGFLLTPLAIAMHRYVLLGEIAGAYSLNPGDPRFLRFFTVTVVFQLLTLVPSSLMTVTASSGGMVGAILSFAFFVVFIATIVISVRALILFPAIAVDAPGAEWGNALADSKGHSWMVFFTIVLTAIPAALVVLPVYFLIFGVTPPGTAGRIVVSVVQSVVGAVSLAAFAAMASHLYAAFAARLGRPAGL